MLQFINQLRREGRAVRAAIYRRLPGPPAPGIDDGASASLGFVPMALATGTGAEVQRPLATVVIGGVISSTALTLFVLPVLYGWSTRISRNLDVSHVCHWWLVHQ